MQSIIDKIPYSILIVIAVLMILAPFKPLPHVFEKIIMLKKGRNPATGEGMMYDAQTAQSFDFQLFREVEGQD